MADILVIDDDSMTLSIMSTVLEEEGHRVRTATDGKQGLEEAQRQVPHLVILDMNMPVMNGYDVARRLRASPATREVPILAATALTGREDYMAAYEAGCNAFLEKPLDAEKLVQRVEELLG